MRTNRIYKINCSASGKAYIGKTIRTLRERWMAHCSNTGSCWALRGAIKKYGRNAFSIELLADGLADAEAEATEKAMIAQHNTLAPYGYNLTAGGQGSAHKNGNHGKNIALAWKRPETREKHLKWRTKDRVKQKDESWKQQQVTWNNKRVAKAEKMTVEESIKMLNYKYVKCNERGRREGWDAQRFDFCKEELRRCVECVCAKAGVPVPPASSCKQTSHWYEKMLKKQRQSKIRK